MLPLRIRPYYRMIVLGMCTTVALAACSPPGPSDGPIAPRVVTLDTTEAAPTPAGPSLDAIFADIALQVPGFAGMYLDTDGTPTIQLVDTLRREAAKAAVRQRFNEIPAVSTTEPRIHRVRYGFDELRGWRERLNSAGPPAGLRLVDIDERMNVLHLGVAGAEEVAGAREYVLALGVPAEGLVVDVAPAIMQARRTNYLSSEIRPTMGGLSIVGDLLGANCSLGFNAKKTGGTRYFVTNAHCTNTFGAVDGDVFGQPISGYTLGAEVTDPAFVTGGGCLSSGGCRYADAALIQYDTASVGADYTAAHTTFVYAGSDSSQSGSKILGAEPFFLIAELSSASLVSGAALSHVGVSSGWTSGTIGSTCFDVVGSVGFWCQYNLSAVVRGGDSGSPVFSYELTMGKAWLAGIVWGRNAGGNVLTFSPLSGVKTDLGAMTVTKNVF